MCNCVVANYKVVIVYILIYPSGFLWEEQAQLQSPRGNWRLWLMVVGSTSQSVMMLARGMSELAPSFPPEHPNPEQDTEGEAPHGRGGFQ